MAFVLGTVFSLSFVFSCVEVYLNTNIILLVGRKLNGTDRVGGGK